MNYYLKNASKKMLAGSEGGGGKIKIATKTQVCVSRLNSSMPTA